MAKSPAHKFGQIIGDVIEAAVEPSLAAFAAKHALYVDKKGQRPARSGKKASWTDMYGNTHDLDFVLERGGSAETIGTPVAFIEVAWRRYTKHSRNKAQEIQGAILPLLLTHQTAAPFIGVIVAGVFTEGALTQLRSLGFKVLYFPHETVVEAFRAASVNAAFDEQTPDAEFARKVRAWEKLAAKQQARVAGKLQEINVQAVSSFMAALERAVTRRIESVRVLPLHGTARECGTLQQAIAFIEAYTEADGGRPVVRYEVQIRYSNGDKIEGQFTDREGAIQFLRSYQSSG
ncbi:MAG: DNA methylase [Verrucomicrobia bacterium]|nr:DNA methylase [Verrucomicrobiota bacterium]